MDDFFTSVGGTLQVQSKYRFGGSTYEPEHDETRLNKQLRRVYDAMKDGEWLTLDEIAGKTGDQCQSISARLRDFRKPRFGGHEVQRRRRGEPSQGIHEYKLCL